MERTSVGSGDLRGEGGLLAPRDAGAERVGDLGLGRCPQQGRTPRRCVVNAAVVEFNKRTNDTGLFEAQGGRKVDNILKLDRTERNFSTPALFLPMKKLRPPVDVALA